jgi:type II secretory pathway pseudopilin PulG
MSHRALYALVGAVVGVLAVVLLVAWDDRRDGEEADRKAGELVAAYREAGLAVRLDHDQLADLLGTDGGSICQLADDIDGSDAFQGHVKTQLRVGGEFGFRGAELDSDALRRAEIVVETYCPDDLPAVRDFLGDLNDRDVVRD